MLKFYAYIIAALIYSEFWNSQNVKTVLSERKNKNEETSKEKIKLIEGKYYHFQLMLKLLRHLTFKILHTLWWITHDRT